MSSQKNHTFHIPVMGLAYTIDTPVKVAHYGISSVVSIIEDQLIESMREIYCKNENEEFVAIPEGDIDHRAKRVTAYLNLLQKIVEKKIEEVRSESFDDGYSINKYFEMLPGDSSLKILYKEMLISDDIVKNELKEKLLKNIYFSRFNRC